MSTTSDAPTDINSTAARPDPGGEWYPEGELPEQSFGSRTTLLPSIYTFKIPENLAQLWHDVEIEDSRPFLPNGMPNPTKGQKVKRIQLKFDRNAPLVVVGGPHDGDVMTATITNNPRARGGKRDDPKTMWISDLTFLLDLGLQGNVTPAKRVRPATAEGVKAEINKYAGKTIRIQTGLTGQCRPDKVRYVRIETQEAGVTQTTDMLDPAQIKGCGKRFYTRDFKNKDAGQKDAAGAVIPAYETEIACDCGDQPTEPQKLAGAVPGTLVVLRGFEQIESFMAPLGT